jgi:transcriptional regulator with XRE-family HTH domain
VSASLYHPKYQALRAAMVAVRKAAGLTQIQIAERLQVGQSFISKMERGDSYVDVLTFVDWCAACGVSPGELLDRLQVGVTQISA